MPATGLAVSAQHNMWLESQEIPGEVEELRARRRPGLFWIVSRRPASSFSKGFRGIPIAYSAPELPARSASPTRQQAQDEETDNDPADEHDGLNAAAGQQQQARTRTNP